MIRPEDPTAKAIHRRRAPSVASRALTTVPTPATPLQESTITPVRPASAITVRTPDQLAILAAANLEAMPPLPRTEPPRPARPSSS